MEKVFFRS